MSEVLAELNAHVNLALEGGVTATFVAALNKGSTETLEVVSKPNLLSRSQPS